MSSAEFNADNSSNDCKCEILFVESIRRDKQ
jgi:hypothetical protein